MQTINGRDTSGTLSGGQVSYQPNNHAHLIQTLSAIMSQVNALQALGNEESLTSLDTLRQGLTTLEQLTRDALYELRPFDEQTPLAELLGVTLTEALSRLVEETAETLGLSSRLAFSGEEHALSSYAEGLLYRIAQETLHHVQQHVGARKLRLTFNYGHNDIQMTIEDDGLPSTTVDDAPVPTFAAFSPATTDTILSDLRHRIKHLGGSLEVHATTEDGTHVRVQIPIEVASNGAGWSTLQNADASPSDAINPVPTTPPTQIRILVVESQAVTRAGLRRLLESYPDLQVIGEAADGVQAVSETLELGPQVVLMDMQLPNGQSLEALRQIKQLNLNTQVLLLSSLDREEYLYETLRAGAGGYVLKDIAPDELAEAVRTVARGEVLLQPQLARRLFSQISRQSRGNYPYETLTAREQEVLRLLARGLRNKEMAARLHVSERTINFHLANIYQKLNVSGRTEALSKALEQGLITA